MISYYFEGNSEYILHAFEEAKISLANKDFRRFVKKIEEYLAYEYNTPFKDFLDKVSCQDILNAYNDKLDAVDFVDDVMQSDLSSAAHRYVALLTQKQKKT